MICLLMSGALRVLGRKKHIDSSELTQTQLSRCLTTLDLTTLGIGSTLGVGIYVVAGEVAKNTAGPSVILSFFIAAVASFFAGLCYAEFGARIPKTGSAYVYSYVTVGEFLAFVIGWNLILEYVIGTASVARGWTAYLDSLLGNQVSNFWREICPINIHGLSDYPDFSALGITLILTAVLACGVKQSTNLNNIFTAINLLVVSYVVICGLFKTDIHNWQISKNETHSQFGDKYGDGGFFPYGFSGTLAGAATCFYAFVGFDCIATTGEEVKNPQKAIPISILVCLVVCFLAYLGVSAIITLMVPYYQVDAEAPLPVVFADVGWVYARYVISAGAMAGLSSSLLGTMFPMPRIIYAMASDGLLFRFLAKINTRFQTPLIATIVSGVLSGLMAMMFNLAALVNMMSIGTLLAYTLVAVCVLILRYDKAEYVIRKDCTYELQESDSINMEREELLHGRKTFLKRVFLPTAKEPTEFSSQVVKVTVAILCVLVSGFSAILIYLLDDMERAVWWTLVLLACTVCALIICVVILVRQPQNKAPLSFSVPFVPFLPIVSIFFNIYLMLKLDVLTWVRFAVWLLIGLVIYFSYGIWMSDERRRSRNNYKDLTEEGEQPTEDSINPVDYSSVE